MNSPFVLSFILGFLVVVISDYYYDWVAKLASWLTHRSDDYDYIYPTE